MINVGGGVRTGDESRVRIDTSEGSIIRIAPSSLFELLELSSQTNEPVTRLKLEAGKVWVLVSKALGLGMFEIETPSGTATVRGSLMSVEQATATGRLLITCLEGQCRLSDPAQTAFTDLTEGQQSEIPAPGQAPQPARPMDPVQLEDWRLNFPEAQTAVQRVLDQLRNQATPTPPPSGGFNLSNTGSAASPHIALDAQGAPHVAWEDRSLRGLGDYFHRQRVAEAQWSETLNLTEGFAYLYGSLSLLRYPDGRMCAFWNGATTGTSDIGLYQRCRVADWAAAEIVKKIGGTARDFSVALAPDGALQTLYIVGAGDIYFNDTILSDDHLSSRPALVVDPRGDYHAVWVSLGDPFSVVHRYRYSVEGGSQQLWLTPDTLSTAEDQPDGLSLSLAVDGEGRVHVVWGGYDGIYYRAWTLTGGWEATVTLTREERGPNPAMAVDAAGRARVVWGRTDGLYYVEQAADGAWSAPRRIVEGVSDTPQIVIDAQGVSHIVWITNNDVYYLTLP